MITNTFVKLSLGSVAMLIATVSAAEAKRMPVENGVKLTQSQFEIIQAVHPWVGSQSTDQPHTSKAAFSTLNSDRKGLRTKSKINVSGSTVQGWRSADEFSMQPSGWTELDLDGTQTLKWEYHDPEWIDDGWSEEPDFPFSTGFYRDGKVCGFHSEMVFYWLVWGYGTFTTDGEIIDYQQFGDDFDITDFSTYVITAAYDEEKDVAYAYTLNEDASGYMLQVVNLDTWDFTPVRQDIPIEEVLVGFCYNPMDKELYGLTPEGNFVKLNPHDGTLTQVSKFQLPLTTSIVGMTYSPYDKKFIFVIPESDDYCNLYTIDGETHELEYRATLDETYQYRILITPDKLVAPGAPLPPEISKIEFLNGSCDGKVMLKLPTSTFDGSDLEGNLKIEATVDGEPVTSIYGTPGTDIEIQINGIMEGIREFSFSVEAGGLRSSSVKKRLYVGFDTPCPPENLIFESGHIEWTPVNSAVNEGYLDLESLYYNVFLNERKINVDPLTECKFEFDMPEDTYQTYVASVEAVNHHKLSERTFSNSINHGNPFLLPYAMTPTRTEAQLVEIVADRHEMLTWRPVFDEVGNSYFICHTGSYSGNQEEWLFLPAINIPKLSGLLEISFDVNTYELTDKNFEDLAVTIGSTQNPDDSEVIKSWSSLRNNSWTRLKTYCYPDEGELYVGFKCLVHNNGNDLMIRNISVKESDLPITTPTEISDITLTPAPKGELKANVRFTLPECDVTGTPLKADRLTATVSSEVASVTISGCPGETVSVDIETKDGLNTINVAIPDATHGLSTNASVYTGIDVPSPISGFTISHCEDYNGLHLEWKTPAQGINGGYVDPEDITYQLFMFDNDYASPTYGWYMAGDLGNRNSYDVYFNMPGNINLVELGIMAQNSKGNSGTLCTMSAPVGTPFALPICETFGNGGSSSFGPLTMECPSDEYSSGWSLCTSYPYRLDVASPYGDTSYVMSGTSGEKGRVVLPGFSTENLTSVGIELPLYAEKGKNIIRISARAYGMKDEVLGIYEGSDLPEWVKCRYMLPDEMCGRKWVEILIESEFLSEPSSIVSFGQYKIQQFVDNDMAMTALNVPAFGLIGEPIDIHATVENQGLSPMKTPSLELTVLKGGQPVVVIPMKFNSSSDKIDVLKEGSYCASWTPDADNIGEIEFQASVVEEDMNVANNLLLTSATIGKGRSCVVTDLEATHVDDGVELRWTAPDVRSGFEGFEGFPEYYFGDMVGDFKTLCLDDYQSVQFLFEFPFDTSNKAWQVLGEKDVTERLEAIGWNNDLFLASTGDRFLMATVPLSYYIGEGLKSDRWLISPEVRPGSEFSFMVAGMSGRMESFEVLYSTSDDKPENFVSIESPVLLSTDWKMFDYTLPADARYFAIRYTGDCSDHLYILLDDIRYEPIAGSPKLVGYDIYRNGSLIRENVNIQDSFIDPDKTDGEMFYNIKPVISKDGVISRGPVSNTAFISGSGTVQIEYGADEDAEYFNLQGIRVNSPEPGIYIKRKGLSINKVLIK